MSNQERQLQRRGIRPATIARHRPLRVHVQLPELCTFQ